MFQFPGLTLGDTASQYRVFPFGHLRIKSCLHFPAAFRSLPRPSSSLRAKASPICSNLLLLELFLVNNY